MDLGLISVRYARALLKAGIEAKEAEKVYADMQTLAQNYSQMRKRNLCYCWLQVANLVS